MRKVKGKLRTYLGIDPGADKGACVFLFDNFSLEVFDWPKSNNYQQVARYIRSMKIKHKICMSVLEKVASMHGQGVVSVWSFGQNYGAWRMLLASLEIRHMLLPPMKWQKGLLTKKDGPDPKSRVKNVVCNMFGYDYFHGPRGGYKDGRGDAALMAYQAKLIYEGKVL